MPDADHSSDFWSSVASSFQNNPAVLFDLFNEPYPDSNQDSTAAWTCWQNGGTCPGVNFMTVGMQSLVNTVRATGANNVIMLGGVQYAGTDDQWNTYKPSDPANQLAATIHVYNFGPCTTAACWNSTLADIGGVPLITGEIGENDGGTDFFDSYLNWADQNGVSYLAWTWDTFGCGSAMSLVSDYNGTPCSPYGSDYQQHLASMAAPGFTSAASVTFTPSTRGSFTVTTSGYPTSVLTETGVLPSGVTFTDNGDGTATLAGVPTATGTFPLTLFAVNGVEPAAAQAFTLNVGNDVPTAITPGEWAPGVTSRNVIISGFGFSPGTAATVKASGKNVTFKSVSVVNATTLDAKLTVAAGAATGTRRITITQGSQSGSCTACLQIDPAPTIASVTPSTIAQGVTHQITVSGTGFVPGATVSFSGPSTKITATILNVTATSLSAKSFVGKAAPAGSYTLNLTNGNGGRVSLPSALTVSPAPTIADVSPSTLAPGQTGPFTITGTGFSQDATVTLPSGVTLSEVSVSADGTTITGMSKVGARRKAASKLQVKVTDGPEGGFGTATGYVLTIT